MSSSEVTVDVPRPPVPPTRLRKQVRTGTQAQWTVTPTPAQPRAREQLRTHVLGRHLHNKQDRPGPSSSGRGRGRPRNRVGADHPSGCVQTLRPSVSLKAKGSGRAWPRARTHGSPGQSPHSTGDTGHPGQKAGDARANKGDLAPRNASERDKRYGTARLGCADPRASVRRDTTWRQSHTRHRHRPEPPCVPCGEVVSKPPAWPRLPGGQLPLKRAR